MLAYPLIPNIDTYVKYCRPSICRCKSAASPPEIARDARSAMRGTEGEIYCDIGKSLARDEENSYASEYCFLFRSVTGW